VLSDLLTVAVGDTVIRRKDNPVSEVILTSVPPIVATVITILVSVYYFHRYRQNQENEAQKIPYLSNSIARAANNDEAATNTHDTTAR